MDSGDFPRITVGGDGFVYVVYRLNNNVMLHKFSSCAQGLRAQRGFPVMVAAVTDLNCPYPGLDRCNTGNKLSSHTVAVDDANPRLVFVAYASNTRSGLDGNDDVRLRASTDGGATWTAPAVMSDSGLEAKRFMPWVCATQGEAFVSWYDRRAASRTVTNSGCLADCDQDRQDCLEPGGNLTPAQCSARWRTCRTGCTRVTRGASNDLTEYWSASARVSGTALQPTSPVNHSGQPDPQCASGWPFSVDFTVDSDACSVQPQLAGFCQSTGPPPACLAECEQDFQDCMEPGGTRTPAQCRAARRTCRAGCTTPPSTNQRCDFDMSTCPSGETCRALGGSPKYGDYNGNACAGGRAFFAWASATAPVGAPSTGGIRLFFDATPAPAMLTVRKSLVPASDSGRFNLRVDGRMVAGQAGNGRSVTVPVAPGAHSVSETAAGTTVAANYTTTFQDDCAPNGQVTLAAGETKTCTIVNRRRPGGNGRQECLERCEIQRQACLDTVGDGDSGVTPARCAENFARCRNGCPR